MPYPECKVYFDGSHYIAIPHTIRPVIKRPKAPEELITVSEESTPVEQTDVPSFPNETVENTNEENVSNIASENTSKNTRILTKKELFEELYQQHINMPKRQRKQAIIDLMLPYFTTQQQCKEYVDLHFDRKVRNLICRKIRMVRKANLANFNYFCTFTYSDLQHTEDSFKKKLKTCFRHLSERKNWRYMGVWERAPETNRLHFHGLFSIPENTLGKIVETRDYDTRAHKMRTTFQCSFFTRRFGRNDFEEIDENDKKIGNALAYIMKYIEKTNEKIVYSKNLPQYFISDIMDDDVACLFGLEDKKLLLFDNFKCIDEGVLIGKVSQDTIQQMRKVN